MSEKTRTSTVANAAIGLSPIALTLGMIVAAAAPPVILAGTLAGATVAGVAAARSRAMRKTGHRSRSGTRTGLFRRTGPKRTMGSRTGLGRTGLGKRSKNHARTGTRTGTGPKRTGLGRTGLFSRTARSGTKARTGPALKSRTGRGLSSARTGPKSSWSPKPGRIGPYRTGRSRTPVRTDWYRATARANKVLKWAITNGKVRQWAKKISRAGARGGRKGWRWGRHKIARAIDIGGIAWYRTVSTIGAALVWQWTMLTSVGQWMAPAVAEWRDDITRVLGLNPAGVLPAIRQVRAERVPSIPTPTPTPVREPQMEPRTRQTTSLTPIIEAIADAPGLDNNAIDTGKVHGSTIHQFHRDIAESLSRLAEKIAVDMETVSESIPNDNGCHELSRRIPAAIIACAQDITDAVNNWEQALQLRLEHIHSDDSREDSWSRTNAPDQ